MPLAESALKAKVLELEECIKGRDKEMADNVAEWQQHCVDLEKQNMELSSTLEALTSDPDYEGSPQGKLLAHGIVCGLFSVSQ